MKDEIEVKFLHKSPDDVRKRLIKAGAKCIQPMRLMRRVIMDFPDRRLQENDDSWLRIRDEGDKVTLTFKQTTEHEFGGAKELEVIVDSYQNTIDIFEKLGFVIHSVQETKRETWDFNEVEVVIDEWPWLDSYIEIEGSSQEAVREASIKLGYNWDDAVFGSVTVAYREQYPAINNDERISQIPEIKFNLPRPDWFNEGTK